MTLPDPVSAPCVYCGGLANSPDTCAHQRDCPSVTNRYPVLESDVEPYGFCCCECGLEFAVGDTYALAPMGESWVEVVCLPCLATVGEATHGLRASAFTTGRRRVRTAHCAMRNAQTATFALTSPGSPAGLAERRRIEKAWTARIIAARSAAIDVARIWAAHSSDPVKMRQVHASASVHSAIESGFTRGATAPLIARAWAVAYLKSRRRTAAALGLAGAHKPVPSMPVVRASADDPTEGVDYDEDVEGEDGSDEQGDDAMDTLDDLGMAGAATAYGDARGRRDDDATERRLARALEDDDEEALDEEADEENLQSRGMALAIGAVVVAASLATMNTTGEAIDAGVVGDGRFTVENVPLKSWVTDGGNSCDACLECEDDGPISLDDAFSSGDMEPPQHEHCGCSLEVGIGGEGPGLGASAVAAPRPSSLDLKGARPMKPATLTRSERTGTATVEAMFGTRHSHARPGVVSVLLPIVAAGNAGEWHAVLCLEEVTTTDGREIAAGALATRALPLPLMCQTESSHGSGNPAGCKLVGQIVSATREGNQILGAGIFDMGGEAGCEAARLNDKQLLRWVSVDLEIIDYEIVYRDGDGPGDPLEELLGGGDGIMRVTKGNLMGVTMVPFPAFPQAVICPTTTALPDAMAGGVAAAEGVVQGPLNVAASASAPVAGAPGGLLCPPAEWFEEPDIPPATWRIDDDGRVSGYLAAWDTPHIGYRGEKVYAPHSRSSYAYYRTSVRRALGADLSPVEILTGPVTLGTGHAERLLNNTGATAHYDNTGTAVADVVCGENEYGIWVAGALRPGVAPEEVLVMRASRLSGDWREIGGVLELVAALVVNVPGFPLLALPSLAASAARLAVDTAVCRAGFHDGRMVSLVAAGVVHGDPLREELLRLRADVAAMRQVVDELAPMAMAQVVAQVQGVRP